MSHARTLSHVRKSSWAGVVCCALIMCGSVAVPAADSVPLSERAVDLLAAQDGPACYGLMIPGTPRGSFSIAVQRQWLAEHWPERLREIEQSERRAAEQVQGEMRQRLDKWIAGRPDAPQLLSFLRAEQTRLDQLAAGKLPVVTSQFVVLTFREREVRRQYLQPPQRKTIGLLAFRNRLTNIEQRSAEELGEELKGLPPQQLAGPVDLRDRLPQAGWDAAAWSAEVALAEFQYREPLEFQAVGETLIEGGDDARPEDLTAVVGQLLQAQVGNLVAELDGKPPRRGGNLSGLLRQAQQRAEDLKHQGFRLTRLELDANRGRAAVESTFHARMSDGSWKQVWFTRQDGTAGDAAEGQQERIAEDPTVRQVLDLARQLGADDARIRQSLGVGTATQLAVRAANREFFLFRDRNLRQLGDGWQP